VVLLEKTGIEESRPTQLKIESNVKGRIFNVGERPVMETAVNVLTLFGEINKILLRARGNSIPNAVAIANIITEKMLKGNSWIENIQVDSENIEHLGRSLSTIEIILRKK